MKREGLTYETKEDNASEPHVVSIPPTLKLSFIAIGTPSSSPNDVPAAARLSASSLQGERRRTPEMEKERKERKGRGNVFSEHHYHCTKVPSHATMQHASRYYNTCRWCVKAMQCNVSPWKCIDTFPSHLHAPHLTVHTLTHAAAPTTCSSSTVMYALFAAVASILFK